MSISASDVKKLRDMTGAGMMDCKKALTEANGDFDKAIENLRKKGQKLATKRADRNAAEGCVIAIVNDAQDKGVIVKLSCETDFVSKNDSFVDLTKKFANIALANFPATLEEVLALDFDGKITIGEKVVEQMGVIGEKLELAYDRLEAAQVAPYIHMGNKAGVLVGMNKNDASFFEAGRNVAMQVAAMKPIALDKDGVDAAVVEQEIEIGKEQARQEGKPDAMLERIATGKLNKFFQENTLVNQKFVKDNKLTIAQYLQSFDKDLAATGFKHITLG